MQELSVSHVHFLSTFREVSKVVISLSFRENNEITSNFFKIGLILPLFVSRPELSVAFEEARGLLSHVIVIELFAGHVSIVTDFNRVAFRHQRLSLWTSPETSKRFYS